MMRKGIAAVVVAGCCLVASAFEKIAFVDSSDYPHKFDIENAAGTERILDRVLETGADVVLWRTHSGAMPRYKSKAEDLDRMVWPVDRRRGTRSTEINGWVTLWGNEPDQLDVVRELCAKRPQVRKWGLHMLLEEAHWQFMYLGAWNLEHPQFWCRKHDGTVQMYHSSFAYPEVLRHRLAIVKELIGYNPDLIYVDTCRNGGYFLANDYVKPNLDRWEKLHPGEPVPSNPSDPRWIAVASESRLRYFRGIRRLIDASGRKIPLLIGVDSVRETGSDRTTAAVGVDWKRCVDEKLVDGVVVASIAVDPEDALGSMERSFRRVMDFVAGRCKVYFPIMAYNFSKDRPGYGQISKWAGLSVQEGLCRQLEIAARCGAAGIVMECVDPDNYPERDQKVIREFEAETRGAPAQAVQATTGAGEKLTLQEGDSREIPLAPEKYRRPKGYMPPKPYPKSLAELSKDHSAEWMARAKVEMERIDGVLANGPYRPTGPSIDRHRCPDWFQDAKLGMLVDWSIAAVASWSPMRKRSAMYPDWYEKRAYMSWPSNHPFAGWYDYHKKNWGEDFRRDHFIDLFRAEKFDADALCRLFKACGARYCVPFVKHHSGYCHWDSSWTFRNTVLRGPHRNFAKEYRDACGKYGLKFGFYFSLGEWEYPLLKDDGTFDMYIEEDHREPWTPEMELVASGKVAVRDYLRDYSIPQAVEFIDKYDPDLIYYDYDWLQYADKIGSYEISAYFYNVNAGKKEVCVNDRYGWGRPEDLRGRVPKGKKPDYKSQRCIRGDFYTDEMGDNVDSLDPAKYHPWECCRGVSCAYGNHWQDDETTVLSRKALVCEFADIVARGGNLGLIVNLDKDGDLPAIQRDRIEALGRWLARWGEAIYATRIVAPYATADVDYTRSKDGRTVYAIVKDPKRSVVLRGFAAEGPVRVLGETVELRSRKIEGGLEVFLPDELVGSELPVALCCR